MLDRLLARLNYIAKSALFSGLILIFISDYKCYGLGMFSMGIICFFFSLIIIKRKNTKLKKETDEEGNVKPNYH